MGRPGLKLCPCHHHCLSLTLCCICTTDRCRQPLGYHHHLSSHIKEHTSPGTLRHKGTVPQHSSSPPCTGEPG
jgi:hypothetical protein